MRIKPWTMVFVACFLIATVLAFAFPLRPYLKNRFLDWPFGEYSLVVHDKTGAKVAEGLLTITLFRDNAVHGTWRLRYYESADSRLKLFSGEEIVGKFAGGYKGEDININLQPGMFDSNDFLDGKLKQGKINGEISFCGFAGCNPLGTFEAIRK